jgi:predicted RNA binding protein YcfA (HicA-like mRNA interferase family)
VVPYATLKKVAEHAGYKWKRRKGSHNSFQNAQGSIVVIPDHGAQPIVRPLTRRIIDQMGLSIEEYHHIIDDL